MAVAVLDSTSVTMATKIVITRAMASLERFSNPSSLEPIQQVSPETCKGGGRGEEGLVRSCEHSEWAVNFLYTLEASARAKPAPRRTTTFQGSLRCTVSQSKSLGDDSTPFKVQPTVNGLCHSTQTTGTSAQTTGTPGHSTSAQTTGTSAQTQQKCPDHWYDCPVNIAEDATPT